jgi:hypothetical protein
MARTVAGDTGAGLVALSAKDANADDWNKITAGIDYYACFVIKHQPRNYFHFAPVLPASHIAQMKEGARLWTEVEPLGRPNPVSVSI